MGIKYPFNFHMSQYETVPYYREYTFREFYDSCVLANQGAEKTQSPQFNQTKLKRVGENVTVENIEYAELLVLDYDQDISNKEVHGIIEDLKLRGLSFIFYDTASSKSNARRFRVIFEIGDKLNYSEYKQLAKLMSAILIGIPLDNSSASCAHRYRLANRKSLFNEGETLNDYACSAVMEAKRRAFVKPKSDLPVSKSLSCKVVNDVVQYVLDKFETSFNMEGQRHNELVRALYLAKYNDADITEAQEIASHCSLPEKEKQTIIRSIFK